MKLNVMYVVNGNLQISQITEWDNNPQGAEKKFTDVWGMLVNEVSVIDAEVKVLDDQLNVYNGLQRHITHPVAEGYLADGKFYADTEHLQEIEGRNDTLYIDITEGQNRKKYKWDGEKFVGV